MFYLAIEGLDGSGNGTLISKLHELFPDAVFVREPGGTQLGEKLRDVIIRRDEPMHPDTEALLYMASRNELLRKVVAPALAAGKMVISDRCFYSTLAYQGATGYSNMDLIHGVTDQTTRKTATPQLVIYLDIPLEVSRARVAAVGELDNIEKRDDDYFNKVRDFYLKCNRTLPNKFRLIDATQSREAVLEAALDILKEVGIIEAS